jgi:GAF domain-containing protein
MLLESAARLCNARRGAMFTRDGGSYHAVAFYNASPEIIDFVKGHPIKPGRHTITARVVLERQTIHVADLQADPEYNYVRRDIDPIRTELGVPMFRGNDIVGVIILYKLVVQPFTDKQIELVTTFADQAVIAIENARLFEAEQQRSRELAESLKQQTATSQVLQVISRSAFDLEAVLNTLVESASRVCEADRGVIIRPTGEGASYHSAASYGHTSEYDKYIKTLTFTPGRETVTGRVLLAGKPVQIADVLADAEWAHAHPGAARLGNFRTMLGAPLLREGTPIGIFLLQRAEVRPFTEKQIKLVETFADQAVIAIENTRLFEAEQQRTRELSDSLEQQTATKEVLQVISSSPGDLRPVFEALLEKAVRIPRAKFGLLFLSEGDAFRTTALYGAPPEYVEERRRVPVFRPNPNTAVGQVAATKKTIQIADVRAGRAYINDPERVAFVKLTGARTILTVPLLKDDELVGVIAIYRQEVCPFTDKQIELVQNFAAQAVIAIENARLLNELRQRTTDLTESLEQQTATSEVLRVISSSPGDLEPVFASMLEKAVRICDASFGNIYRWQDGALHLVAAHNTPHAFAEARRRLPLLPGQAPPIDRMVATKTAIHVIDVAATPEYIERASSSVIEVVELGGVRTALAVPMVSDNELIGSFTVYRQEVRPFTDRQIELVTNFAAQAVIAVENTRLLNELRESLQQQTATADVLKVISRSTFDLQTVLETLIESAARLCAAEKGTIQLGEGDVYRVRAHYGLAREAVEYALLRPSRRDRGSAAGRVALEGKAIQIPDVLADPEYHATDYQQAFGYRTILGVPLLRDGTTIGSFSLLRDEVRPFNDKQIELVTVFADQAVIAVENARLLTELRESLQQQSATADVLKVISRSAFDLQTVLDTLVESAARLCDADSAAIHRPDGNNYPYVASYGYTREYHEYVRERPIIPGRGTVLGRAVTECKPIQVNDVEVDREYTLREGQRLGGFRTVLGIPLLREGVPIGVIVLTRNTVRPFTDKQIELATTFADQAAIAIQNVRLFEAEQQRTQELARSLEELRTAQDRLVQTEKLASLGQLTAGIAHEIKNPLNFVNNFSAVSVELIDELREALGGAHLDSKLRGEISEIADTLQGNLDKVVQHGKRADAIVKNMLLHSRQGSGEHRPVDINALVDESLNLTYHGARAEKQGFTITLERSFDPAAGEVDLFPQEITRALLNLISNGFYAATKRKAEANGGNYEPTLAATTKSLGNSVEIRIRDNGTGIPPEVREKLFSPFFTTKPAGEGTGLGLSISHDIIVKQHGGSIEVDTQPGEFTEFRIILPRAGTALIKSGERL